MEQSELNDPSAKLTTDNGFTGNDGSSDDVSRSSVPRRSLWNNFKWTIPSGIAVALAVMAAVWFLAEPEFRSSSRLRIIERPLFLVFAPQEHSLDFGETQLELLKDPAIIRRAIDNEGLAQLPELREVNGKEDHVEWIGQRLKAARIGKSELYEVSFTTRLPQTAQRVVDAIVETYIEYQASLANASRDHMLVSLAEEVKRYDIKIEQARSRLRDLAKKAGGEDDLVMHVQGHSQEVARAAGYFSPLISNLQQKLAEAQVEVETATARVQVLTEAAAAPIEIPASQIAAALRQEPEVVALTRELAERRAALDKINQSDAETRIRQEIATKQQELKSLQEELRTQLSAEAEQTIADQQREALHKAQADLKLMQEVAKRLTKRLGEERQVSRFEVPDVSLELQFARDELGHVVEIRKRISDRAVQIATESRAPDRVYRIHKATLPEFPEGPTLTKPLVMIGVGALFVPFLLLIGWDLIHRWHYRFAA